jgi:hypothetical protein
MKKKRKGIVERYEEARRAWAEKGGRFRYLILRYWTWRYGRTTVGRAEEEIIRGGQAGFVPPQSLG